MWFMLALLYIVIRLLSDSAKRTWAAEEAKRLQEQEEAERIRKEQARSAERAERLRQQREQTARRYAQYGHPQSTAYVKPYQAQYPYEEPGDADR